MMDRPPAEKWSTTIAFHVGNICGWIWFHWHNFRGTLSERDFTFDHPMPEGVLTQMIEKCGHVGAVDELSKRLDRSLLDGDYRMANYWTSGLWGASKIMHKMNK